MATKVELEEKVKNLQKEIKQLKVEVKTLITENDSLENSLNDLKSLEPTTEVTFSHSQSYVTMNGRAYIPVLIETAQELIQAIRRGEVLEYQTCIVIDREGA